MLVFVYIEFGLLRFKRGDGLRIPHLKIIIGPKFCTTTMTTNSHTPTPLEACAVVSTQGPQPPCDFTSPYQGRTSKHTPLQQQPLYLALYFAFF